MPKPPNTCSRLRTRFAALLALSLLTASACGNRLSHERIVAENQPVFGSTDAPRHSDGDGALEATDAPPQDGAGASPSGPSPATKSPAGVTGAAGGATSASGASRCTGKESTVKLGHIGTYTGAAGASFKGADTMVQVWAKDLNARGGVNCHPVELFSANDDGNPARTRAIARDMVETKGVIAFISPLLPLSLSGITPYLEEKKTPAVGGDGLSRAWWSSQMLFPQATYLDDAILGGARISVRSYNQPKIGVMTCREVAGCQEVKEILGDANNQKQVGYQVVSNADVSLTQPDFTAECLSARDARAQTLWLAMDAESVSRVARSCASQDYHPLMAYTSTGVQSSLAEEPALRELIFASTVFPFIANDFPAASEYQAAARKYAPELRLNGMTAQVWAGGKLFEFAARNLPANPKASDVIAGLYAAKNETLGGLVTPLTFTPGQLPTKSRCYFAVAIREHKFVLPWGSKITCP